MRRSLDKISSLGISRKSVMGWALLLLLAAQLAVPAECVLCISEGAVQIEPGFAGRCLDFHQAQVAGPQSGSAAGSYNPAGGHGPCRDASFTLAQRRSPVVTTSAPAAQLVDCTLLGSLRLQQPSCSAPARPGLLLLYGRGLVPPRLQASLPLII